MANHNVSVSSSSFYDPEVGTQTFTNVSPSSLNVTEGDTLTVTYTRQSGGQTYVDIVGWDSGEWNSTATARLYNGQSVVRTLLASSGSDVITANFPASSFTDRSFTVTHLSSTDTTPDSFNLGAFIGNASLSTLYKAQNDITVSGLSSGTPITASITNGVFTVDDSNSANATSSNKTVYNGSKIRVWNTSSSAYSTAITTTLNLNGVTDTWRITTISAPVDPSSGTIIPFGTTSGAISMGSLRDFFGNPTYLSDTIAMSNLYKGGDLVPNITQNNSVPTSGQISLSNLYGCHTSLLIDKQPVSKYFFAGIGGAGTATIAWNMASGATSQSDVDIGYKALKHSCEYRWVINQTNSSGNAPYLSAVTWGGTTYTSGLSFPYTTPWFSGLSGLLLDFPYGVTTGSLSGTAYLEVRRIWNGTTYTLTTDSAFWSVIIETAGE